MPKLVYGFWSELGPNQSFAAEQIQLLVVDQTSSFLGFAASKLDCWKNKMQAKKKLFLLQTRKTAQFE